LDKKFLKD